MIPNEKTRELLEYNVPIRVIPVVKLEFVGKDIVQIKRWDDFIELCKGNFILYKLENYLYLISETVAFLYDLGKKEGG